MLGNKEHISTKKVFLHLLVQETRKGNRPDTHFNKEGWKTILETINEETGLGYTRKQPKNHWDCTRKPWKIWCRLVGASGMKWDPETRCFGATNDEWRMYIRENPWAGQFRHYKEIPHVDKLAIVFSGVIEPESETYTPPLPRSCKKLLLQRRTKLSPRQWHDHDPIPLGMLQESPICVEIESANVKYCIKECIESLEAMRDVVVRGICF